LKKNDSKKNLDKKEIILDVLKYLLSIYGKSNFALYSTLKRFENH